MGQLVYRMSSGGDSPSEFRISGGIMQVPAWSLEESTVLEVAYVHLMPISDTTGLVIETDFVMPDQAMLNLRPMVRFELDGGALDVGAQLPVGNLFLDSSGITEDGTFNSIQLLSQYRGSF